MRPLQPFQSDLQAIRTQRHLHRAESTAGSQRPRVAPATKLTPDKKGKRNEAILLDVVERMAARDLPWVLSARSATREEDERGVDVFVWTDVGDVGLQSKSSRTGIRSFLENKKRRARHPFIACVLVEEDVKLVALRVRWALASLRRKVVDHQRRWSALDEGGEP